MVSNQQRRGIIIQHIFHPSYYPEYGAVAYAVWINDNSYLTVGQYKTALPIS